MVGTDECQPADRKVPRVFRTVWVRFGPPVRAERSGPAGDDRLLLRQITDEVMYEVRELSGYTYVDTYASRADADTGGHDVVEAPPAVITPLAS
jgi:1-acyl-sn-glycerol-3-phosphate acyltransferase